MSDKEPTQKVSVRLPINLVRYLDRYAQVSGKSRSEIIRMFLVAAISWFEMAATDLELQALIKRYKEHKLNERRGAWN